MGSDVFDGIALHKQVAIRVREAFFVLGFGVHGVKAFLGEVALDRLDVVCGFTSETFPVFGDVSLSASLISDEVIIEPKRFICRGVERED